MKNGRGSPVIQIRYYCARLRHPCLRFVAGRAQGICTKIAGVTAGSRPNGSSFERLPILSRPPVIVEFQYWFTRR